MCCCWRGARSSCSPTLAPQGSYCRGPWFTEEETQAQGHTAVTGRSKNSDSRV